MSTASKRQTLGGLVNAAYLLIAFVMLFPILWTFITSLKDEVEIFRFPPSLWPPAPTTAAYTNVWASNIPLQMFNSVKVAAQTIGLTLITGTLAGFAFARADFKGKNLLLFFMIGTQMIPGLSNVITLYMTGSKLNLLNKHIYLVLIYAAGSTPTCTWLMKGYFEQIPPSLDEAALVDGCTRMQILLRIILPLVKTGLLACAMLVFVNAWNEFLVSLTMVGRTKLKTFPVGLQAFIMEYNMNWANLCAATIMGLVPVLVLFLSFQKSFIEGVTAGAIKA